MVAYAVRASDPDDTASEITIFCSPAAGAQFALARGARTKRTTVSCQAHDQAGNAATPISFTVTVLGFHDQLAALELQVNSSNLSAARKVTLTSTLAGADHAFRTARLRSARAELRSFISHVRRLPATTSRARKARWIGAATRALAVGD